MLVLREKAGNASLQILDSVCENPEMIWTTEMQGELRESLQALLLSPTSSSAAKKNSTENREGENEAPEPFSVPPKVSPDFFVKYRQISGEIFVGGVYIRLYLKQPTFRLSNAVFFLEKLVEFWESSFNIQVPLTNAASKVGQGNNASDSRAVVLGNEDFLSLLTSCIVCVVKGESSVVEHLITWGFVQTLPVLLKRALVAGVADDGGFGFAIAKALAQAGAERHRLYEDVLAMISGTMFVSLGTLIYTETMLTVGSSAGLALLLSYVSGWGFGPIFFIVNLPFYILAVKRMGWAFTFRTFTAVALVSVLSKLNSQWIDFSHLDPLYATVIGGGLIGLPIGVFLATSGKGELSLAVTGAAAGAA